LPFGQFTSCAPLQKEDKKYRPGIVTGRVWEVSMIDQPSTHWPPALAGKAKTAGCRLRFMLEEKRKGKMKN